MLLVVSQKPVRPGMDRRQEYGHVCLMRDQTAGGQYLGSGWIRDNLGTRKGDQLRVIVQELFGFACFKLCRMQEKVGLHLVPDCIR
jgi:hypothetical protein